MDLFNLFWQQHPNPYDAAVALGELGNTLALDRPVRAAILWPALYTPEYLEPGQPLQLLIGGDGDARMASDDLRRRWIARCLRATRGLDAGKLVGRIDAPFVTDPTKVSTTEVAANDLNRQAHYQNHRAAGVLHESRVSQFKTFFWVVIDPGGSDFRRVKDRPTFPSGLPEDAALPFTEWEDELLTATLDEMCGTGKGFRAHFKPGDRCWTTRDGQPVCAYHPVVVGAGAARSEHRYLHVSDLHLSSRQDILCRSPARVIEALSATTPTVGSRVANNRENFRSTIAQAGSDLSAVLVGGDLMDHAHNAWLRGRDPQASVVPEEDPAVRKDCGYPLDTVQGVWERVRIDAPKESNEAYASRYLKSAFVDLLDVFQETLSLYKDEGVGVYAVSGNHDAYKLSYGISPRASGEKGNEGIPSDHNLTFHEATLAFGRSYGALETDKFRTARTGSPNFYPELLRWFHTVFSAWSSFLVPGPAGPVLGLGWGDSEQLFAVRKRDLQGSKDLAAIGIFAGRGFLPRATNLLTPDQKKLLRVAANQSTDKLCLVLMHPPLASYHWAIPEFGSYQDPLTGLKIDDAWKPVLMPAGAAPPTKLQMGTFSLDRQEAFRLLSSARISAVVAGHSHRRGIYAIGREPGGTAGVPDGRRGFDPTATSDAGALEQPRTAVIGPGGAMAMAPEPTDSYREVRMTQSVEGVTDRIITVVSASSGPVPRRNRTALFGQWGSESPGGTVLILDPAGKVLRAEAVFSDLAKPRGAVVLDYMQHMETEPAMRALTGLRAEFGPDACPGKLAVSLELNAGLAKAGLRIVAAVCAGSNVPYLNFLEPLAVEHFSFELISRGGPARNKGRLGSDESTSLASEPGRRWFNFGYLDPSGVDLVRWRNAEAPCLALKFEVGPAEGGGEKQIMEAQREELGQYTWDDWWTLELNPLLVSPANSLVPRELPEFTQREAMYGLMGAADRKVPEGPFRAATIDPAGRAHFPVNR